MSRGNRNPLVLSLSRDGMRFDRHYILKNQPGERLFPGMYKAGTMAIPIRWCMTDICTSSIRFAKKAFTSCAFRSIRYKRSTTVMQTFQFDLRYCILHVGIGGVHEGVKGIGESCKEAIAALQHQKGNRDCEIIEYERLDIRPNVNYTFTDEIKLLNLLKAGDAALKEKIGQYLQQQKSRMSSHEFRVLITDVYRTGLRFIMEQGLEREEW